MPTEFFKRKIGTHTFAANEQTIIDMPREHFYDKLLIRVRGQVDSGTTVVRAFNNPMSLVQRIEIIADGQFTLKSFSGESLFYYNLFRYGQEPERVATPAATSQSDEAYAWSAEIDMAYDTANLETKYPSYKNSNLQMKVTWGSATDMDSGTSFNVDNTFMDVASMEVNKASPLGRQMAQAVEAGQSSLFVQKEFTQNIASSGEQTVDLPLGNIYTSLLIRVRDNSLPDDELVDNIQVKENDLVVHRDIQLKQLQQFDMLMHDVSRFQYTGEAAASERVATGYTMVDFDVDGSLLSTVPTKQMDSFKLVGDTGTTTPTGTADIRVLTQEIV